MEPDDRPQWDQQSADTLVGATIIVGITILTKNGAVERQVQMHGTIAEATETSGIRIELAGTRAGESYTLPPDLMALETAPPGSYRLRSTGEVIEDPDYKTSWTMTRPD